MKKLIENAVKLRKYLLRTNKGKRNSMAVYNAVRKFETMLQTFPHMSDAQWAEYTKRNMSDFSLIVPDNASGKSIMQKVQNLIP